MTQKVDLVAYVRSASLPRDVIEVWGTDLDNHAISLATTVGRAGEKAAKYARDPAYTIQGKRQKKESLSAEATLEIENGSAPLLRRILSKLGEAEKEAGAGRELTLPELAKLEGIDDIWKASTTLAVHWVTLVSEERARVLDSTADPLHLRAEIEASISQANPWPLAAITSIPKFRRAALLQKLALASLDELTANFWRAAKPEIAARVVLHQRALQTAVYNARTAAQRIWALTGVESSDQLSNVLEVAKRVH